MSERWVAALAVATLAGGWAARPVPWMLFAAAGLIALVGATRPMPLLACAGVFVAASALGARAWDGVRDAPTTGNVVGVRATIVQDPAWRFGSLRTELRLEDGRRVSATASSDAAAVLGPLLAGERVVVDGRRRPVSEGGRAFLARRHIGSVLAISAARDPDAGGVVTRFTNELRRTLVGGASSLPMDRRALFTGLVLGDDRQQAATEVDDFRAAGLTHLLAVSGQNVAFILAIAAPLLRQLSMPARFLTGVVILISFGILTRWEPSVLRAVAMAGLSLGASTLGRPASSVRILSLAIVVLVLVDPLLAGSVGFLLSASACAGIAVLSRPMEQRGVPAPLAVTLAAQAGVAPVLLPVFGGIPLASLPANLLAVPAAGPVMIWGIVAGLPAGLVGGDVAAVLHVPTRFLLAWISGVARAAAALPLPLLDAKALAGLAAVVVGVVVMRRRPAAVLAAVTCVAIAAVTRQRPPPVVEGAALAAGARMWRSTDGAVVLVLAGNADEAAVLAGMRSHGVRGVDVLVLRSGGTSSARLAATVRHRSRVRLVLAPPGHHIRDARTAEQGMAVVVGDLTVTTSTAAGRRLDVRVVSARAPRARSPPVRRHVASPRHGHPQPDDRLVLRQGRVLRPRRPRPPGR